MTTGKGSRRKVVPLVGEPVVPVVALSGANASGKSNLLAAVRFATRAVVSSHRSWEPDGGAPIEPFLGANGAQESFYEFEFVANARRWIYGFVLSTERVVEEWLYDVPKRRRRKLFTREGQSFSFGRSFTGQNRTIEELTRTNSLFISAAAQNAHPGVQVPRDWLAALRFASPDDLQVRTHFTIGIVGESKAEGSLVEGGLRAADIGVRSARVEQIEFSESVRELAMGLIDAEGLDGGSIFPKTHDVIRLEHRFGDDHFVELDFDDESTGTQAWFAMLGPLVKVLSGGGVLFFDELEQHLHPHLVRQVVEAFSDERCNPRGAQLVFTTQRTEHLRWRHPVDLESKLLGKAQIWFAEKSDHGATTIYPLTEYRTRKRDNLERAYLEGRYGAVPDVTLTDLIANQIEPQEEE